MIIKSPVTTNLKIEKLEDLYKLKPFMKSANLKINKSQIARELDVDRRTVDKYINGFHKSKHRTSSNCLTPYKDIIRELLSDENEPVFYYRRVLWQYLCDNHGYHGAYSNFCYYLSREPEFAAYFRKRLPAKSEAYIRYETPAGKQAQLDWKAFNDRSRMGRSKHLRPASFLLQIPHLPDGTNKVTGCTFLLPG